MISVQEDFSYNRDVTVVAEVVAVVATAASGAASGAPSGAAVVAVAAASNRTTATSKPQWASKLL